ncbi:alpha-glucosidase/alpha-galactosidase [Clostridium sp. MCC353]|nr:alpha-glucosidase/alpha-galactosidase [Clostridium sp. MCC353]
MRYDGKKAYDIKIAYIGGGSRGWAWKLMADLALEPDLHGTVALYDIDYERALRNERIGNRVSKREDAVGKWKYQAVDCMEKALNGADFVIASILPGTFDEMESDVHEPEKYGIYQSVGDTVGPGGLIRALRTFPIYEELALKIREICPDAWLINYTNPMTLCTRFLYEVYPQIKAFGCCHEIFGTQRVLANVYKMMTGETDVDQKDIRINVLGINHFTWIDRAFYKNQDIMPYYRQFVEEHYKEGVAGIEKGHWLNQYFQSMQRVKFDLFRKFGLIAAAGDRHLAEFVPQWYLDSPKLAEEWKFSLTPVSWRKERAVTLYEKSLALEKGEEEIGLKPSGEEGVAQMKALLGLAPIVTNVNLPNTGQMKDLPMGCVVETNASFDSQDVRPVIAGSLPEEVRVLVLRHVMNQETIVRGYRNEDKELIFKAFINDPSMKIRPDEAGKLFDAMIENTKKYLPEWLC